MCSAECESLALEYFDEMPTPARMEHDWPAAGILGEAFNRNGD